ncbi:vomeronasal type-2 receptor 116-like isoform X2 [Grammomys surdaster]|uniref:vomeronasal type-2 receptor 116-like isoform X2 n=1 Tax=Grammomys surdaster TaxID=491861 RepID=UPI00109FC1EB|nr:vomeronasal type-2 receptor 116-like isoform X2 [Grammomys surdaster]
MMFTPIFIVLLLKLPFLLCNSTENMCFWRIKFDENCDGDLPQDCAFLLYTEEEPAPKDFFKYLFELCLPSKIYQYVLTLYFAMEEINSNPYLLPNVSLEIAYINRKCNGYLSLFTNMNIMTKYHHIVPNYICDIGMCEVALTGPLWISSAQVATILQLKFIPQITYGPFHPLLSDQNRFPNLHQIAPKDRFLSEAIVSLLLHFSWTWVGLVIQDDDQGIQFLLDIREEMQRNGVCLAFVNVIPQNMQLFTIRTEIHYNQIITSSSNVVIIYGEMNTALEMSFKHWEYLGTQKIWFTTSRWDVITRERDFNPNSFHGTFTISQYHGDVSNLNNFFHRMNLSKDTHYFSSDRLGWMYSNCTILKSNCKTANHCTSSNLWEWLPWHSFDMAMNDECYNIYNAVYAVAHAFHEMFLQKINFQQQKNLRQLMQECLEVHAFLKNMKFFNPIGDIVIINQKTKTDAEYEFHMIWNFPQGLEMKVKIGQFYSYLLHDQKLYLYEDMIQWVSGYSQIPPSVCSVNCAPGFKKSYPEEKPSCCFDCSPCPENEISNATDLGRCVKCPDGQYANTERNHCFPKAVTFLAYGDLLGIILACVALCLSTLSAFVLGIFVKNQSTPIVKANNRILSYILLVSLTLCFLCPLLFIGQPSTARCLLQQVIFGILFTVVVSTVLAKTITVLLAFKITVPGRKVKWLLLFGTPKFIILICSLFQLMLCGFWLGLSPPFVEIDANSEHDHITIMCNKGSIIAFYCMMGYLGCLALASFVVAFLGRNLPDTFNEAKFLTFSMLVFCSVWVTFLPVYHSTKGKVMVAVEVFSILASSAGILGCIFIPKCYIIVLRPDRNFIQKLKVKNHS